MGAKAMDLIQNQYLQAAALVTGLIAGLQLLVQAIRAVVPLLKGIGPYIRESRLHLDKVTDESIANQAYMSACVVILLVRILAALFGVIFAALFTVTVLFSDLGASSLPYGDWISLIFLVASSAFLLGTLASAKRFSELVRSKVAPETMASRKLF
jgi:hypothetical protein